MFRVMMAAEAATTSAEDRLGDKDAWYWNDTKEDPDRERRRQAEFLVHNAFPWDAVEFLAVKKVTLKEKLENYLHREWPNRIKPVRVEAGWYF